MLKSNLKDKMQHIYLVPSPGGGGGLWISSVRDDPMGKSKPKKIPEPKIAPLQKISCQISDP